MLARDDLPAVALELPGFGADGAKLLTARDERRDVALEALDAGIRIRHNQSYDVRMRSLATPKRKKCVSV
jgi:hypothetical protein